MRRSNSQFDYAFPLLQFKFLFIAVGVMNGFSRQTGGHCTCTSTSIQRATVCGSCVACCRRNRCRCSTVVAAAATAVVGDHWRRPIENQFRYLATLYASAICTLRRTLKLKVHIAHAHLGHALLPEETQLGAVQYHWCRVVTIRFDLYWILKEHVKRIARTIREKFRIILGKHTAQSFQIDFHIVIGGSGGWAIQAETDDENAFVHRKLYRIATAAVAPLVRSISTRLESMTHLGLETGTRLNWIL